MPSVPEPCCRQTVLSSGSFSAGPGAGGPAELRVERMRAAGRRQQHDRRRFRIDRLAVLRQREVVDPAAPERDGAAELRRLDRDARRRCDDGFAGHAPGRGARGRLAGNRRRAGARAGAPGCACAAAWPARRVAGAAGLAAACCCCCCLELRFLALLLHLRHADEVLPCDQHQRRQHDGEDGVLLIGHCGLCCALPRCGVPARFAPSVSVGAACTRRSARSNSSLIRSNGALKRGAPSDQHVIVSRPHMRRR